MRKIISVFILTAVLFYLGAEGFAAEERPARPAAAATPLKPAFAMVFGEVTKIDKSDPARPAIEVKGDVDGKVRRIELTPATSVTKLTDISELKEGDTVRVMARRVDNKEVAISVMFSKFKKAKIWKGNEKN